MYTPRHKWGRCKKKDCWTSPDPGYIVVYYVYCRIKRYVYRICITDGRCKKNCWTSPDPGAQVLSGHSLKFSVDFCFCPFSVPLNNSPKAVDTYIIYVSYIIYMLCGRVGCDVEGELFTMTGLQCTAVGWNNFQTFCLKFAAWMYG